MTKSKGNVIDPLHLIDQYAPTRCAHAGRDGGAGPRISSPPAASRAYRNFRQVWNACRSPRLTNACAGTASIGGAKQTLNRWIAHGRWRRARVTQRSRVPLQTTRRRRSNASSGTLFCDCYLEWRSRDAGPDGRPSRDAADGAWGARPDPQAAASVQPFLSRNCGRDGVARSNSLSSPNGRAAQRHHHSELGGAGRCRRRRHRGAATDDTSRTTRPTVIGWWSIGHRDRRRARMNIPPRPDAAYAGRCSVETRERAGAGTRSSGGWRGCRRSPSAIAPRTGRCSLWCAAGSRAAAQGRDRSRAERARSTRTGDGGGRHQARRCQLGNEKSSPTRRKKCRGRARQARGALARKARSRKRWRGSRRRE